MLIFTVESSMWICNFLFFFCVVDSAWPPCQAAVPRTPSARAACLFWARLLGLCLRLGESEVSVCCTGGNPQASVVFASLPVLVLAQTLTDTYFLSGRTPVSDCVTFPDGNVGHVTYPKSLGNRKWLSSPPFFSLSLCLGSVGKLVSVFRHAVDSSFVAC